MLPGRVVAEQEPFFITLGGPKAHDSSGPNEKRVGPERKAVVGLRPSFSAHVRWCEHGAPVRSCRTATGLRARAAVSHISRKTSEMWGTRRCGGDRAQKRVVVAGPAVSFTVLTHTLKPRFYLRGVLAGLKTCFPGLHSGLQRSFRGYSLQNLFIFNHLRPPLDSGLVRKYSFLQPLSLYRTALRSVFISHETCETFGRGKDYNPFILWFRFPPRSTLSPTPGRRRKTLLNPRNLVRRVGLQKVWVP